MTNRTDEGKVDTATSDAKIADETVEARSSDSARDILKTVVYALLIALLFRTVAFQPFSIPSGSMKPTLLIGDYLFVSKYAYGYSRYSLPFGRYLPESVFGGRIFSSEPERGDVIVFRHPVNDDTDFIKRVVGLPGDRVRMSRGVLFINGEPVDLERLPPFVEDNVETPRFRETLPNGLSYEVLDRVSNGPGDNTAEFAVPDGAYMFVGDNRDNSSDSRFRSLGFVPSEHLIGRAEIIMLSSSGAFWELWKWRGDRFLKWIY